MNTSAFRLLVVDDSESMRRVITGVLTRLGFEQIDQACNGVEGLEMVAATPYDLVVSDLYMPLMTGVELLKGIRALPARSHIPVLIVSGQLSERNIREALEAGVDGFVAKPFVEEPLTERVTHLLLNSPKRPAAVEGNLGLHHGVLAGHGRQRGLA